MSEEFGMRNNRFRLTSGPHPTKKMRMDLSPSTSKARILAIMGSCEPGAEDLGPDRS